MAFHLPDTPEKTPLILVAAGSGIAPFRGFIQHRAAMIRSGRKLAPAVLYHGCREPGKDDVYSAEFTEWEKAGAVIIKRAFSRKPEESGGSKYVQDIVWQIDSVFSDCGKRAHRSTSVAHGRSARGLKRSSKIYARKNRS